MKLGDIRIYDKNLDLVSVIPRFIASNWELKFCGYGCGEIEFERNDEMISLLHANEYLFLVQDGIQSIITGYKTGKTCTVFTRTLEWLLTKFVVKEVMPEENLSKTVESILSNLPEAFGLRFCGIDDEYDMSGCISDKPKDIHTVIKECIGDKKIGFSLEVDFSSKKFLFSLLSATENKNVIMCDEYRTSYDSEYTHHIQEKATGAYFYHDITNMGNWDPLDNKPTLSQKPDNYGKYYTATQSGYRFGFNISKGDIIFCDNPDGTFRKVTEPKPFLVEVKPKDDGIFSWSVVLDVKNEQEAAIALRDKTAVDMLTAKTKLVYRKDYQLGDIIKMKFYGRDKNITEGQMVTEVNLWTEREDSGECPVMIKICEEDENGI